MAPTTDPVAAPLADDPSAHYTRRSGTGSPVTFDLGPEQAREYRANLRTSLWYGAGAIGIGVFALIGALASPPRSSTEALLGSVAVLMIGAPSFALYYTFTGSITAIGLSDGGVTFRRTHRPPLTITWSDPKLGIAITELTVPPSTIFPGTDPRAVEPRWVFVSPPVRNQTTVSAEVALALTQWAEAHGARVDRSPALVYLVGSPRSPAVTPASRKIAPGESTTPNGRLTLIGPAAHSD